MNKYDDFTNYDFTSSGSVLPDFTTNAIPADVDNFVDEPVKQLSGLQKRLIFYPLLIIASVLIGHIGGVIFFANDAYNSGLLTGDEIASLEWYFNSWKD